MYSAARLIRSGSSRKKPRPELQRPHRIARTLLGVDDLRAQQQRWVFIGDSTNDQTMFEQFTNSVGVANIARFADRLRHLPHYVTPSERGAGFAEVARAILDSR